jgi:pyruvate/2-oxoglutarate dehydrogenase complex dihydrolipoamide acyltransferase (E2) component
MKTKQVELELSKNLGNYETAKIRLVATITDKENVEESIEKLNTMILKTFAKLYNKKAAQAQTPAPAQAQAQTQTQTPAPAQAQTQAQTPAQAQAQTPAPAHQEIKRDESGKIIVEFSTDKDSLFQRIKRAVRVRKIDPEEVSKFYTMDKKTFQLLFV